MQISKKGGRGFKPTSCCGFQPDNDLKHLINKIISLVGGIGCVNSVAVLSRNNKTLYHIAGEGNDRSKKMADRYLKNDLESRSCLDSRDV